MFAISRAVKAAARGALRQPIVLMHNQPIGNPATVSALPTVIPLLPRPWLPFREAMTLRDGSQCGQRPPIQWQAPGQPGLPA